MSYLFWGSSMILNVGHSALSLRGKVRHRQPVWICLKTGGWLPIYGYLKEHDDEPWNVLIL